MPTRPGITVLPCRSIVLAPAGTATLAAGPTCAIFPPWMMMVSFFTGAAPVPSITVALVSATTGSETVTYAFAPFGCCAPRLEASPSPISVQPLILSSLYGERSHHPRGQVLRDVTVQHPSTGIAEIQQNVHRTASRNQDGVFPHQILARDAVYR